MVSHIAAAVIWGDGLSAGIDVGPEARQQKSASKRTRLASPADERSFTPSSSLKHRRKDSPDGEQPMKAANGIVFPAEYYPLMSDLSRMLREQAREKDLRDRHRGAWASDLKEMRHRYEEAEKCVGELRVQLDRLVQTSRTAARLIGANDASRPPGLNLSLSNSDFLAKAAEFTQWLDEQVDSATEGEVLSEKRD